MSKYMQKLLFIRKVHFFTHTDTETLASPHVLCYPKSICTLTDTCAQPRLLQTDILLQMQILHPLMTLKETHIVTLVQRRLPSIYEVLHVQVYEFG